MRNIIIWAGALCSAPVLTFSQGEADQWMLGYKNIHAINNPAYYIMGFDFRHEPPVFNIYHNHIGYIQETAAYICDAGGNTLFWTNGMQVQRTGGDFIIDTLGIGTGNIYNYWDYYYRGSANLPGGFPKHNGAIVLPLPGSPDVYSIIHHDATWNPEHFFFQTTQWYETRIELDSETQDYFVQYKLKPITERLPWNTGYKGVVLATRHGNGRDWWLVVFRGSRPEDGGSDLYEVFLLDPGGLHHRGTFASEMIVPGGIGQAVFSPGGRHLARIDAVWSNQPLTVTLYDFDRCSGMLSIRDTVRFRSNAFVGVAFSPNERFLYADNYTQLWQFDLWAEDLSASRVLIDTFDGYIQPGWVIVPFGPMTLGHDGRIYMASCQGGSRHYNVIHRPNEKGKACDFRQHQLNIPAWNGRTAPNFANYRLGPLDDSPCDTLGLDNHTVAKWRYEEEIPGDPATIRFTDQSYFDPHEWHWDFDDGSTASTQHPIHTYATSGTYYVCLTVRNSYSEDTHCKWVDVIITSAEDVAVPRAPELLIYPNPFTTFFEIRQDDGRYGMVDLTLYDMHGRIVMEHADIPVPARVHVGSLPDGMYAIVLQRDGRIVRSEKMMKY